MSVMVSALEAGFTEAQVSDGRAYHRPLYPLYVVGQLLTVAVLSLLAFSGLGTRLYDGLAGLSWAAAALAIPATVVAILTLVRLPLTYWRGFVHEHRFGLSTQSRSAWLSDRAKSLLVSLVLTAATMFGLVALARELDGWWPAVAAPAALALVILLSFVRPVVTEPLFNRFEPLHDGQLARDLRTLADGAGVPVRQVLVADASRRTRRQNAYVSGLGRTRRIVLYDTLLERSSPANVRLVTAHEIAHRREHHVAAGALLGATSAALFVLLLWGLLSTGAVLSAIGAGGADDPRVAAFVLLTARGVGLVTLPFGSLLSRRWERAADRISMELTRDLAAFESVHRELALSNLSDLEPPAAFYSLTSSHPTAPERITRARETALRLAAQT